MSDWESELQRHLSLAPAWTGDLHAYMIGWARNKLLAGEIEDFDKDAINALTRATLYAGPEHTFSIVDFNAIEARYLAWQAGDEALCHKFASGAEIYGELSDKVYGLTPGTVRKGDKRRQLGKVAVLGCGYGMGGKAKRDRKTGERIPSKFEVKAKQDGVDWEAIAPITAETVVETWRANNPLIVQFWRDIEDAAWAALNGEETTVGPTQWAKIGDSVWCWLASGRPLVYHSLQARETYDEETGRRKVGLVYKTRKGWEHIYGGKFTENITQALSRDHMTEACCKLEKAGFDVRLTVYDEILTRVPRAEAKEALALQEEIMCEIPIWATGVPIAVEGFLCERYRK